MLLVTISARYRRRSTSAGSEDNEIRRRTKCAERVSTPVGFGVLVSFVRFVARVFGSYLRALVSLSGVWYGGDDTHPTTPYAKASGISSGYSGMYPTHPSTFQAIINTFHSRVTVCPTSTMTVMPGWQHRGRTDRRCGYRGGVM